MVNPAIENDRTSYDIECMVEGFHWWFVVRRKLIGFFLSFIEFPKNCLALEVGCGTGANLEAIRSAGLYGIGLDRSTYPLTLLKLKKNSPILAGDLNNLPIKTKSIHLIIAMDVLEHLDDDVRGINESFRVLKDEGRLILTVPAFGFLWGIQDRVTGHKRRYSRKEILNRLKEAGFTILKSSYFNFFLFFPILGARFLIRLLGLKLKSENQINFPLLNSFLKTIFSIELYALKYFSFPFGVSIFCIAQKVERSDENQPSKLKEKKTK